jgi:hypothetical protein
VSQNVCARVATTGMKLDFSKELSLGFGDYCEVYDGTGNTTRSRSIPCVALYPCCNVTGLWAFYSLMMRVRICWMNWKKMVTTFEFIEKMNALDQEAAAPDPVDEVEQAEKQQPENNGGAKSENIGGTPEPDNGPSEELAVDREQLDVLEEEDTPMPGLINQDDEDLDDEADEDSQGKDSDEEEGGDADDSNRRSEPDDAKDSPNEAGLRHSSRIRDGVKNPGRYALVTKKLNERDTDNNRQKRGLE